MILKVKTETGWHFVDDIQEAEIHHIDTGELTIDVQYHRPNRTSSTETFVVHSECYLMNDAGKTIESVRPA